MAAESLRQALEALRSAVHRAADTDLELLIRDQRTPAKDAEDEADGNPGATAVCQPLADATLQFQTDYIRRVISQCDGNMSMAAERLGLHRANLYRKMRQLRMVEGGRGVEDGPRSG
jgi:DNA-binding NtrC family response regulator